jgi:hypothetical protein
MQLVPRNELHLISKEPSHGKIHFGAVRHLHQRHGKTVDSKVRLFSMLRICGSRIVLEIIVCPFRDCVLDPFFLHVFLAICSISELEATIATVFATF